MSIYSLKGVKVGDVIYDSGLRRDTRQKRSESFLTVTKVARKYLTATYAGSGWDIQFDIETARMKSDYGSFRVYRSKQAYQDIETANEIGNAIHEMFGRSYYSNPEVPLETLIAVADLLGIKHD